MKTAALLFVVAFFQQFMFSLKVRNIASNRILAAATLAFLLSFIWGIATLIIATRLGNPLNLFFYGLGAAAGTTASIFFDNFIHPKKKKGGCE